MALGTAQAVERNVLVAGYDANGNQTSRKVGGINYTLIYDAESRLSSVSGTVNASFGYIVVGKPVLG